MKMKKLAIIGIVVLVVLSTVTCDILEGIFQEDDADLDKVIEYTDVAYSDDGSKITIYLDGYKPVPVTKRSMRAMSTRLAKMSYDYLEVIFDGTTTLARAQWELGESAGISGVDRDEDYAAPKALLAAGRKEGRTLVGIGELKEVDETSGTTVATESKSVTFYVEAVKTGLLVDGESTGAASSTTNEFGIMVDSFKPTWTDASSKRAPLGGSNYPTYALPTTSGTYTENYVFAGGADTYKGSLILRKDVKVEPRIPRYIDSGRYMSVKATTDFRSDVKLSSTYTATEDDPFVSTVPVEFTVAPKASGVFSFYIEVPVYLLTKALAGNTGKLPAIPWNIRTGLGSELYSLDDGFSSGGCVLMSIGEVDLDWLEIQFEWVEP
jgi:hypothetical protein